MSRQPAVDPDATRHDAEVLLPRILDELRALARSKLAKLPPGQTLQATALVNEAYMRVVGRKDPGWHHEGHLFAALATTIPQCSD